MSDVVEAKSLPHGQKTDDYGDSGYQSVEKSPDANGAMRWHVAMKQSKPSALDKTHPVQGLIDKVQKLKCCLRLTPRWPHPRQVGA